MTDNIIVFLIILNLLSFLNKNIYDAYRNVFLYINFFILIFIFFIRNKIYKNEINQYMFIIAFTIYGVFTLFINDGGFGSILTPIYSFFLLFTLSNTRLNDKKLKSILITLIFVNIFWVLNSKDYYLKFLFNKDIYINSNTIAMVIMYSSIYIKIYAKKLNIKFYRILTLIIYIISSWGIFNLQSRTSLFGLVAFIIMDSILPKKIWENRRMVLLIFSLTILAGTIFPFIYVKMYTLGVEYVIPFTTKSLYSGREAIWLNFINYMDDGIKNWIFGLGSRVDLWVGHDLNLHNNYLAIITNFGILGYILYYGFIIMQINNIYKNKSFTYTNISLIIGFMCVLIIGFVEISTLFHPMFFLNFSFLGLAMNTKEEIMIDGSI